jgi:dihydrofolate reductase
VFKLIVAYDQNLGMAYQGKLPWKIPSELKLFKDITSHHSILMGRKTFESIGRLLPNRKHYIVTQNKSMSIDKASMVHDLNSFLKENKSSNETIYICGGLEIYQQCFDFCDEFFVSVIQGSFQHDLKFMNVDWACFECVSTTKYDEFIHYHYRRIK